MGASLDRRPSRTEYLAGLATAGTIFVASCGPDPAQHRFISSEPPPKPQHAEATAADASLAQPAPTQQEVRLASVRVVVPPNVTQAALPPLLIPTNVATRIPAIALASSTHAPEPPPRAPTAAATATAPTPREQSTPLSSRLLQSLQALAQAVSPAKSIQAAPGAPPADQAEQLEPPPPTAAPPTPSSRPSQTPVPLRPTEPVATRALQATNTLAPTVARATNTAIPAPTATEHPVSIQAQQLVPTGTPDPNIHNDIPTITPYPTLVVPEVSVSTLADLWNGNLGNYRGFGGTGFAIRFDPKLYRQTSLDGNQYYLESPAKSPVFGSPISIITVGMQKQPSYKNADEYVDKLLDKGRNLPKKHITIAGKPATVVFWEGRTDLMYRTYAYNSYAVFLDAQEQFWQISLGLEGQDARYVSSFYAMLPTLKIYPSSS